MFQALIWAWHGPLMVLCALVMVLCALVVRRSCARWWWCLTQRLDPSTPPTPTPPAARRRSYPDSSVTEVGAKELSQLRADDEERAALHAGGMHQPVGP